MQQRAVGGLVVARAPFLALVGGLFAAASTSAAIGACNGSTVASSSDSGASSSGSSAGEDSGNAGDAGESRDATASDAANGKCEDDDGIDPSCDGFGATSCTPTTCDHYRARYKSRVARNAIACVKDGGVANACTTCGPLALAAACDDPTAAEACRTADAFCVDAGVYDAGGSPAECRARLSGMSFGGRISFISCVTESLCQSPSFRLDQCAR